MVFRLLRRTADFLARWPGLPVLIAIALIILNFLLRLLSAGWPAIDWLVHTDLLLHLGLIIGFLGLLLGDVL